jgi:hypothetical protein
MNATVHPCCDTLSVPFDQELGKSQLINIANGLRILLADPSSLPWEKTIMNHSLYLGKSTYRSFLVTLGYLNEESLLMAWEFY